MDMKALIDAKAELTDGRSSPEPIVMSSRIRFARNLQGYSFPGWAKEEMKKEILKLCEDAIKDLAPFKGGEIIDFEDIEDLDKQVLAERHLISQEFSKEAVGAGVLFSKDQSCSIMINEEDHLRIQVMRRGYKFRPVWKLIDTLDNAIDKRLNFAFSQDLGYLTACPTNLGTGMRASMMMHLPGLVMIGQMDKVIRACNQLNLAVRGIYGEGTDASGSIFQISNQQTLGESEKEIVRRLTGVLDTVIEQEHNARKKLLEKEPTKVFDKVGRAYGILRNGYFVTSSEAMNLLSLMRLGVDLNIVPAKYRRVIDRLIIECQPGHIQAIVGQDITPEERDVFRADLLRAKFRTISALNFDDVLEG